MLFRGEYCNTREALKHFLEGVLIRDESDGNAQHSNQACQQIVVSPLVESLLGLGHFVLWCAELHLLLLHDQATHILNRLVLIL